MENKNRNGPNKSKKRVKNTNVLPKEAGPTDRVRTRSMAKKEKENIQNGKPSSVANSMPRLQSSSSSKSPLTTIQLTRETLIKDNTPKEETNTRVKIASNGATEDKFKTQNTMNLKQGSFERTPTPENAIEEEENSEIEEGIVLSLPPSGLDAFKNMVEESIKNDKNNKLVENIVQLSPIEKTDQEENTSNEKDKDEVQKDLTPINKNNNLFMDMSPKHEDQPDNLENDEADSSGISISGVYCCIM